MSTDTAAAPPRPPPTPPPLPVVPPGDPVGGERTGLRAVDPTAVALVALAGGLGGLVSLAPGLPVAVAAMLTGVLVLAGPGGLMVAWLPAVPRPLAAAAVPGLGLAFLSLVAAAELAAGWFNPRLTTAVVSGVVLVGAAVAVRRHGGMAGRAGRWFGPWAGGWSAGRGVHRRDEGPRAAVLVSAAAAVAAAACAAVGMVRMAHSVPTDFGPLVRAPELGAAAVLVAVAFGSALWARSLVMAWSAIGVSVLVHRGPTFFPTETALYEWTYRHLGVIDWFVRAGYSERDVDVYNNWPGALALGAWFVDTSGLDSLTLAHGFQFGYHLSLVLVVYALGRCAGLDRFGAVAGAFVVEVASWVAQDYLSPQAFTYLLAALAVAALLVTTVERFRAAGVVIGLVLATAVVWAHQLTPIWLVVAVAGLAALRLVRPRGVVLVLLVLLLPSVVVNLGSITTHVATFSFNVFENTQGNVRTVGSTGQQFTSGTVKVLSVAVWAAAVAVVVAARNRGERKWRENGTASLAVVGFSPFVLLATSYGGETVFRVFLFSLLGCGPLLGGALSRVVAVRSRGRRQITWRAVGATVALAVVSLMGIQGFLGGWYALRFTTDDVETARRIELNAGPTGSVVPLEYAYPLRSTSVYLPQARDDALVHARWDLHDDYVDTDGSDAGPARTFTEVTEAQAADRPVYVVVSDPIRDFVDYFGILRPGAVDRVVGHLRTDGWQVVLDSDGTLVLANPAGLVAWR